MPGTEQNPHDSGTEDSFGLKEQLAAALKDVAHWKSNHACEVSRAKLLKQRPDMPLERIAAYDQVGALHGRLDTIRDAMAQAEQNETIKVGAAVWQRMRSAADLNSDQEGNS